MARHGPSRSPTYASIGIAAPILVLIGRLLQGFSAGVELGGVSIYLFEIATPGNKGFYTSFQSASQQVAIFVAAIIGFAMSASLTSQQIADGGWRIPFFIGCLIVPFIFVLRRSLQETPEFLAQKKHPSTAEIFSSMAANLPIVLLGMLLVVLTTVTFYLITVYTPTFGKSVLKLTEAESLLVTLCVACTNFVWLPIGGALSDRIGRKTVLLTIAVLAFLTAYPALAWLVASPTFGKMLMVELLFSFYFGVYNGAMVAALSELVPKGAGDLLLAGLSWRRHGGTATRWCDRLINTTGDKASPGFWLMAAGLCGIVSRPWCSIAAASPCRCGLRPAARTNSRSPPPCSGRSRRAAFGRCAPSGFAARRPLPGSRRAASPWPRAGNPDRCAPA